MQKNQEQLREYCGDAISALELMGKTTNSHKPLKTKYDGNWKACPSCGRGIKIQHRSCGYCGTPYAWLEPKVIETKEVTENKESRLHPGDIKA